MKNQLTNLTIVITGASSGIGKALALEAAKQGANLVLIARSEKNLKELAEKCNEFGKAFGTKTLAFPGDITNSRTSHVAAEKAIKEFGKLDVWINNAGVALYAKFERTPLESFQRVIETNFLGCVYGSKAALPHFKMQNYGTLINFSSVIGGAPQPYSSAYVASKYAIRGFSGCLRMELELDGLHDVHVCTVMPAAIDTPIFQHSANYTGWPLKPLDPVYSTDKVVSSIVNLINHPKQEIVVGEVGNLILGQNALAPGFYEKTMAKTIEKEQFHKEHSARHTEGNLFEPSPDAKLNHANVSGSWPHTGEIADNVERFNNVLKQLVLKETLKKGEKNQRKDKR
ncbi:MAG: SDR family oxidoreductase [Candidatus Caenarcaniphilales bacterium]|nr:SDR family oxidoreductase [Candidatus Caenarcaniphilales bacterium]